MSSFCILLIDDDPSINFLNKKIIEMANVEAQVCDVTQASDALSQISDGKLNPSLILLDINMPTMDGWQFLEQYEQLPEARKSKIIVLSSTINPTDKQKAENSSLITNFYSKPLSIDDVKEIRNSFINDN